MKLKVVLTGNIPLGMSGEFLEYVPTSSEENILQVKQNLQQSCTKDFDIKNMNSKLIYQGKLLQDKEQLKNLPFHENRTNVIHLVLSEFVTPTLDKTSEYDSLKINDANVGDNQASNNAGASIGCCCTIL